MFKIKPNRDIILTKGDSAVIDLYLISFFDNGTRKEYVPAPSDEVIFYLKSSANDYSNIVMQKELKDNIYFYIKPEDTENLTCGLYYYTIKLLMETGDVFTVVPISKFKLVSGVNQDERYN